MTAPPLKSAAKYVKSGRFRELFFRSRLYLKDSYGTLRYEVTNKLNREKLKIVSVNGSRMYIHLGDNGISKDLYLYHGREKFASQFLETFLKDDDVVIDIGANIGYYVLMEHRIVTRGEIFACEPAPFNRKLLELNLELNGIENVKVFPFAIGEGGEGEREFYIYDRINWASFNRNVGGKLVDTINVKTLSLDSFIDKFLGGRHPTVLRMDVEGHEYEILKGAQRALSAPKLKIFMEIHPHLLSPQKLDELLNTLEGHGFAVKAIINECQPHEYGYLSNKIWSTIQDVPYGFLGTGYAKLRYFLRMNKGSEVFFEKTQ